MNKSSSMRPRRPNEIESINKQNFKKLEQNTQSIKMDKSNKISIGDAIGLITIRLCKLEERSLKEPNLDETDTPHVLKTICGRLTDIESKQLTTTDQLLFANNNNNNNSGFDNIQITKNDVEIDKLKTEVDDLKKLLLKLQEKILDIVTTK